MSLILASSVIRSVPPGQQSGRLVTIEFDGQRARVIDSYSLPENEFRGVDPNPRGGTRGLRGVSHIREEFVVSDSTGVFVVNASSGQVEKRIEHPLMGGVHSVAADDHGLWVVSTHADAVLRLDWAGNLLAKWCPTECEPLATRFQFPERDELGDYRDPSSLVEHVHDVTHMNAVHPTPDGFLISLGSFLTPNTPTSNGTTRTTTVEFRKDSWQRPAGDWSSAHAIVQVDTTDPYQSTGNVTVRWSGPAPSFPNHDIVVSGNYLVFNDSNQNQVVKTVDGKAVDAIDVPGDFLRGMTLVGKSSVVVGTQHPLALHLVDLDSHEVRTTRVEGSSDESFTSLATLQN